MKGFTLIETIIYIALFALLMSGLMQTSYVLYANLNRHTDEIRTLEEGKYILEKIDSVLLGAEIVYEPVLGSESGILRLKNSESLYRFELQGGSLMFKKDYGEFVSLNSKYVEITYFSVTHGKNTGEPAWVRVSLILGGIPFNLVRYTRL
jgi:hypothetical protein